MGAELCRAWGPVDTSGRFSRPPNNTSRRGKPANHTEIPSAHWPAPASYVGQQVYVPHTASMPIPVPVPSTHSRHAIPQAFSRVVVPTAQPIAIRPQSPVQFGGQPMNFQPHMRPQPPRYSGTVMQPLHIRTAGPASGAPPVMRPSFNSPRK